MCRGTRFTYKQTCTDCKDRGTVEVPNNILVRVPQASNDNDRIQVLHPTTGKPLEVTLKIRDNEEFRRRGYDVFTTLYIPYSMAVLGGTQTINSLFGGEIKVRIPPGTETDTNIRLAGKGIGKKDTTASGDHVLVIKIKVPKLISEKQKSLLSAFATLENHPILESSGSQLNQPRRSQQEAFIMAKKNAAKFKNVFSSQDRPN